MPYQLDDTLVPLLGSKPYLEFTVTEPGEVIRLRAYDGAVYLPTTVTAAYDEVMVLSICQKTEAGLSALVAYVTVVLTFGCHGCMLRNHAFERPVRAKQLDCL